MYLFKDQTRATIPSSFRALTETEPGSDDPVPYNNILTDAHIKRIMTTFDNKVDVEYIAKPVTTDTIANNDRNLSVSAYGEAKDTREVIDIDKLNKGNHSHPPLISPPSALKVLIYQSVNCALSP